MKDLIEHISKSLVDNPDDVTVNEIVGDQTIVIELKVSSDDLGKVIGKKGRTAHAMRTLLAAIASKNRKRAVLEIID
ncbi:MAG: KH domain-containing protein [Pseudomonadota bacterium]